MGASVLQSLCQGIFRFRKQLHGHALEKREFFQFLSIHATEM